MSGQDVSAEETADQLQPFMELWATYMQQLQQALLTSPGVAAPLGKQSAERQQWLDTLSRQTEAWLRSPPFLQAMKALIDALIASGRRGRTSHDSVHELGLRLSEIEKRAVAQVDWKTEPEASRPASDVSAPSRIWGEFLSSLQQPGVGAHVTMGATPHQVIFEQGSLRLLRYSNPSAVCAEPVLLCYALVNRPYILDLQGNRSVVRRLLERGLDVFLIDWGVPTDAERSLRLDDYISGSLRRVVEFACTSTGASQLNLLGYCMGGTMATMFTALYPERVRNLILMATPIDFAVDDALLGLWARHEYFDVDRLIDTFGNCPGEFLKYCFQLMKPVQNFAEKYVALGERLGDQAFLENFLAMERWSNDSIPVAGETFREFVKSLYQQNRLVKGQLSLGGVDVRLDAITCPILLLVAEQDHLVPPAASQALAEHVKSREVRTLSIDAGHVGLAVSSKAHRQLWPQAADWIVEHSTGIS